MRYDSFVEASASLRARLTEHEVIAAGVARLQAQGHNELSIWRHFLEVYTVDLDALAVIIDELFGSRHESAEKRVHLTAKDLGGQELM